MHWQPISTAKRDPQLRVLLYSPRIIPPVSCGHWHEELYTINGETSYAVVGWFLDGFQKPQNMEPFMPTHWMPLPEPPEGA